MEGGFGFPFGGDPDDQQSLVRLLVHANETVRAGDALIRGPLVPHDILRVSGEEAGAEWQAGGNSKRRSHERRPAKTRFNSSEAAAVDDEEPADTPRKLVQRTAPGVRPVTVAISSIGRSFM